MSINGNPLFQLPMFNNGIAAQSGVRQNVASNHNQNSQPNLNQLFASSGMYQGAGSNGMGGMMQMMMMMFMMMFSGMFQGGMPGIPDRGPIGQPGHPDRPNHPNLPDCPLPPAPPEPPVEDPKLLGSAGLFGDPQFGLFTPSLDGTALDNFASNIKNGETVTLLDDPDNSGFKVSATGVQVNPEDVNSTGIGRASINFNTNQVGRAGNNPILASDSEVLLLNNGDIHVRQGDAISIIGNINDAGLIDKLDLGNGVSLKTSNEIDGVDDNGNLIFAERVVIENGEYKVTAGHRSPHADANSFWDMNFEEKKANAADNANGYETSVAGLTGQYGIASLLGLESLDQIV